MWTPCDEVGDDNQYHCPYEDTFSGFVGEMCRICCGLGVDQDSYPEEEPEKESFSV